MKRVREIIGLGCFRDESSLEGLNRDQSGLVINGCFDESLPSFRPAPQRSTRLHVAAALRRLAEAARVAAAQRRQVASRDRGGHSSDA